MNNESAAINWDQCLERAAGRQDIAKDMLHAIIDELPIHKRELIQAYEDRDIQLLASIAHKLSGLCCYSGLPQLKVAAQTLEEEALDGHSNLINEHLETLLVQLDQVVKVYNKDFVS